MNGKSEEAIFEAALALQPAKRAEYVHRVCGADTELCQRVEALLRQHEQAAQFLAAPAAPAGAQVGRVPVPLIEMPGDKIGHYRLLQEVGEGGYGVVYMAEQQEPIRRRVALKIIKLGMDTKAVIARFEAERQALALMDHPNIARVLDAGATDTGRPYFVMELVRGIKITEYCDQGNLPTEERLNLFIQVCHAIQHAHQKGIIHRDIKPSNILVTINDGVPVPKVIDFGIAKATGGQVLTDKTLFTAFEQFIGTPAYMSPEQAELTSLDIDTRSDIYALGVLLYELLTSHTPFDARTLGSAGLEQMRRIIREKEPVRPSTRLSSLDASEQTTVANRRRTEPPKLLHDLRGDLDWIVMKCLEKDRTRRYETADGLAMDLQRHLRQEPVLASPPDTAYRLKKFVRRNRVGVSAAAVVVLALTLGLSGALLGLFRARRAEAREKSQRQRAEAEASKSGQVAQFLKDMLQGVGPSVALGRDTRLLREILDKTVQRVGKDLTNQPDVEADLRSTIGEVYRALGQFDQAEAMQRQALDLRRRCLGSEHPDVAWSLEELALALQSQRKLKEAEALQREALAMRRKVLGPRHAAVAASLGDLANVLCEEGKLAEAETLQRQALAMRRELLGDEHEWVALSLNNLGALLFTQGKLAEAVEMTRDSLRIRRKLFGTEHPSVAESLNNLAAMLTSQGNLVEGESRHREALALHRKLLGNEHPSVAVSLNNLGRVLRNLGKLEEAEERQRQALAMRKKIFGDEHLVVATSLNDLALVLADRGKPKEAEAFHREALAMRRKLAGQKHPEVAVSLENLGRLLLDQGRASEAQALARECLTIREANLPDDWRTFSARCLLGSSLLRQQDYAEAEPLLVSGYQGLAQRQDRIPLQSKGCLAETARHLAECYEATGRTNQAAEWRKKLAKGNPTPMP